MRSLLALVLALLLTACQVSTATPPPAPAGPLDNPSEAAMRLAEEASVLLYGRRPPNLLPDSQCREALGKLEQAISLDPELMMAYNTLAQAHLQRRDYSRAAQVLEQGLAVHAPRGALDDRFWPGATPYRDLAAAYALLGQEAEARRYWEKHAALFPWATTLEEEVQKERDAPRAFECALDGAGPS
jgi:tetratricopeptide (TPR) repeat protein